MKKQAILIGDSGIDHDLTGVVHDIQGMKNFLMSNFGGAWDETEILILLDKSKQEVLDALNTAKTRNIDMGFVMFSGHGKFNQNLKQREMEIRNSTILHETLIIFPKQITILDTCAGINKFHVTAGAKTYFANSTSPNAQYRMFYEKYISQCPRQQINLFSCSIGEYSNDTAQGGLYTKNLLSVLKNNNLWVLNAVEAQKKTIPLVSKASLGKQNPDYMAPKISLLLPLAIHL